MNSLLQDLRFAIRMLAKNPGFTAVVVLTLALGIGANTAVFSLIHAALIRPLPFKEPQQLVALFGRFRDLPGEQAPLRLAPDLAGVRGNFFVALRHQTNLFQQVARVLEQDMNLTGSGRPERVRVASVSTSWFPLLGVPPAHGRAFLSSEDQRGSHRVVIASYGFWQRRFAGNPDALGQTITLDRESYTVVGVMPPNFQFPLAGDLWTPLAVDTEPEGERYSLGAIARLQPGVTVEQAQASLDVLLAQMQAHKPVHERYDIGVCRLHDRLVNNLRPSLRVLLAAVALVLLIGCANVANLLLARAATREREIAIRAALGAGRARVFRQLLTESMLLALLGGVVGLGVAVWGVDLLLAALPDDVCSEIPGLRQAGLHPAVLGFAAIAAMLTGVVFGLAPALASRKWNLNELLKTGTGSPAGKSGPRNVLVVTELALALMLLIGAGLIAKSLYRLQAIPLGFDPDHLLTLELALQDVASDNSERLAATYQNLLQQIETVPGVKSVGATMFSPFTPFGMSTPAAAKGQPTPVETDIEAISPDYLPAMGVALLRGRRFTWADRAGAAPVVLLNETAARQWFPDDDPIGQQIQIRDQTGMATYTVAGVVGDIRQGGFETAVKPRIYWPWLQHPFPRLFLAIRTATQPTRLAEAVQQQILAVNPDQPAFNVQAMEQRLRESVAPRRLIWFVLGTFSVLAWVMAIVGTYGVIAYAVAQRTREIGIRMALGAQRSRVIGSVLKHGLRLIGFGLAAGLCAAAFLTRVLAHFLYEVSATDAATFAGATLLLSVVALAACYLPARRATKVDPMVALRCE